MTTNQSILRSDLVRKRRTQTVPQSQPQRVKRSYRSEAIQQTAKPVKTSRSKSSRPVNYSQNRRHYDIAFSTSKTNIRTPGITIPTIGTRLVSGVIVIVVGFILLTLWNSSSFRITGAQVVGNQLVSESEINAALMVIGKPIFTAIPAEIEQNLLKVYPEIKNLKVRISLPNRIIIQLSERTPTLLWQKPDGSANWIDASDVKFPAREPVENLVTVIAYGDPPPAPSNDTEQPTSSDSSGSVFIEPAMIHTIAELVTIAPPGSMITYDPDYGLGWQDPRGWLVYIGENTQNVSMKLTVYQAIIDKLTQEGVQPSMISVEYVDAPFYRTQ